MEYLEELTRKFLESGLVEENNYYSVQLELTKGKGMNKEFTYSLCAYPRGVMDDFSKQTFASGLTFEDALKEFKDKISKLCQ